MPRPMKKQQPLVPKKDADAPSSVNAKDNAQPVKARPKAQAAPSNDELTVDLLRERRYLWTARAFAIVSAVALCLNLVLMIAMANLMPLKRAEPFLLTFQSKDDQVVRIRPLESDLGANDLLTEAMIRQYVLLRNTMTADIEEMSFRWGNDGPLRWMSSPNVYKQFAKTIKDWLARVKLEGLTREVRIESVVRQQDIWVVYIVTRDMLPEADQPVTQRWRVKLKVRYFGMSSKNEVKYVDRLKNPLGFVVSAYAIESAAD